MNSTVFGQYTVWEVGAANYAIPEKRGRSCRDKESHAIIAMQAGAAAGDSASVFSWETAGCGVGIQL